jgi:hypothetical protein
MRYTLFLYENETDYAAATPEYVEAEQQAFDAYVQSLTEAGAFVATDWLQPTETATTVSLRDGRSIQDGPYADTKEQLGGFFVIDVPDLDAAIAWAERCPGAKTGIVEVRPSAMDE